MWLIADLLISTWYRELTRLLICDDQPAFVKGLALLIESDIPDVEVVGATTSVEEALALVERSTPDLVLLDPFRSGTSGTETIRLLKAKAPGVKIIVFTQSKEEQDVFEAIRAGAAGYTTKDREVDHIGHVLRSVAAGNFCIPAEMTYLFPSASSRDKQELTDVERTILAEIGEGHTDTEMAESLHFSLRTLRRRVAALYRKIDVRDRLSAALYANRRGWKRRRRPDL